MAIFQTKQFLLLPSIQFLCLINSKIPPQQLMSPFIDLLSEDLDCYQALRSGQKELTDTLKLWKKSSNGDYTVQGQGQARVGPEFWCLTWPSRGQGPRHVT